MAKILQELRIPGDGTITITTEEVIDNYKGVESTHDHHTFLRLTESESSRRLFELAWGKDLLISVLRALEVYRNSEHRDR
jgi:hypothetical protein